MTESRLTINQLAEAAGVTKHTLRYYESMGLLPRVERDPSSGHRRYQPVHAQWVAFIKELRGAGMPVRDVATYARLAQKGEKSWFARWEMLAAHRESVRNTMAALEQHLKVLDRKLARGCGPEKHKSNGKAKRRLRAAVDR